MKSCIAFSTLLLLASPALARAVKRQDDCEASADGFASPAVGRTVKRQDGCEASADGFASLNGGTTGGSGGEVVTVSSQAELEEHAGADGPVVIRVEGRITISPLGHEVPVGSDKTIVGVGADAEIYEGGFRIIDSTNVIIRNLAIGHSNPGHDENDFDGIQADRASNVWIDHCLFENTGDGLLDLRMDTTYFTVSNNIFRGQDKAFGIGWTDNVVARGTIHHNWFDSTNQRNPSTDNMAEAHLYNNYLYGLTSYGHYMRGNTAGVVENVFFENTNDPLTVGEDASLTASGNIFENCSGDQAESTGDTFNPSGYYSYELTPAEDVPDYVRANAGPQASVCS